MPSLGDLLGHSTTGNLVARLSPGREVYAAGGYRWLCEPPGAVQSAFRINEPSTPVLPNHRCMALAVALPDHPQHVLDLGSGCGAMLAFARGLPGLITLTGVEADPEMLLAAREHFALPQEQPVVVEDAMGFLARGEGRFDLVFCDVFEATAEPAWLDSRFFYEQLDRRLESDGAAAINMLPSDEEQLKHRMSHACAYFPGVGLASVAGQGNVVMFLSQRPLPDVSDWRDRVLALELDQRGIDPALLEELRVLP